MIVQRSNTVKDIFKQLANKSIKFQRGKDNGTSRRNNFIKKKRRKKRDEKIREFFKSDSKIKIEGVRMSDNARKSNKKKLSFGFSSYNGRAGRRRSNDHLEQSINRTPVKKSKKKITEEMINFDINAALRSITVDDLKPQAGNPENFDQSNRENLRNLGNSYTVFNKNGKLGKRRASAVFAQNTKEIKKNVLRAREADMKKRRNVKKKTKRIALRKKKSYVKENEKVTVYKQILSSLNMENIRYSQPTTEKQRLTREKIELFLRKNFPKMSKGKFEAIKRQIRSLESLESKKKLKFGRSGALRKKYVFGNLDENDLEECIMMSKEDRFDSFCPKKLNMSKSSLALNEEDLGFRDTKRGLSHDKIVNYRYSRGIYRSYSEIFERKKTIGKLGLSTTGRRNIIDIKY